MMGHPELVAEMEREELGPLISTEGLEQLQNKYVQSVRVSRPQTSQSEEKNETQTCFRTEPLRLHHVVAVTEECVRVDAQSSTGGAAGLAARPGAGYRP